MTKQFPLRKIVSMGVGGPSKYFKIVRTIEQLRQSLKWAKDGALQIFILGEGINVIPSDKGFNGLIIKNQIKFFRAKSGKVLVGAGNNLYQFIRKLNRLGLADTERMAGIPGTVGGAIFGNAGAYGQEIKDCLKRVQIFDGKETHWLSKNQCQFKYRESVFKRRQQWVIIGAEFQFLKSNPAELQRISRQIVKLRAQKYWPSLKCPGSFFKNIVLSELSAKTRKQLLRKIDRSKIKFGKLPSAHLLESAGAKGLKIGGIAVAKHHANLIYNTGHGTANDIRRLAANLKQKARRKFNIILEEEIRYL